VRGAPHPVRWLVFDAEAVRHVDATGLEALMDIERGLTREDITLVVARMKGALEAQLDGTGLGASIPRDRRLPTVRAAVEFCLARDAASSGAGDA
jgi:MFS superfamily sulfate permease-like transporter